MTTLIVVALGAGLTASLLGFLAAGRMARPLTRLAQAARGIAGGNLHARTGLAERTDEFGAVGEAFDQMASELERADEQRRRFIEDAVHELRTPLTVIDGTAGAIEEGVFAPEPRHLRTIREQAQLMSRLVEDVRTISLAETGNLPLERERVDLAAVAAASVAAFEARAKDAGLTLSADVGPRCVVDADARRLRQVIAALADNALRHTPPGGSVRIVARRLDRDVHIAVEDSGGGIAGEDLPHIFDRFYQADPSRDRRTGSSGLGLSIVRAVIEAHGGTVGAENAVEGGARVWVRLPRLVDV